jgi:CHAT domain-containing protein
VTEPKTGGQLIHFAVHGVSDPDANDQALLLDDKTRLLPSALAGRFRCGETPAFSFVFLNACQVGTAASCLGQAAGFPGDLIRGGTLGFLAPLWDVDDEVARAFAERFYAATLDEHQTLGEVLAAQRAKYAAEGSTTPMAYIYYGHPNLRLTRAA